MRDKVKIILKDGSTVTLAIWQKIYGLRVGSDNIGRHYSLTEARFKNDIEKYGELVVNEQLMIILDGFREAVGKPVTINSFNRNEEHQKELKAKGFRAATVSPHVVKLAADIDTISAAQTNEWVKMLKQVASISGIKIRIGYMDYMKAGQSFIHVDVCPEYFAPGKPYHKQSHPKPWESAIIW